MNAVEIKRVSKSFGRGDQSVHALDTVSCEIAENEFFTLLGPSGCGKTTLLRLIAGFEQADGGEIFLKGERIDHLAPHLRPVNTVFQSYALFPHLTVAENVGFGLQMLGKSKAEAQTTISNMLRLVRLQGMEQRRPAQLSGGQQQRVALARALACRPKLLLLDEPLSALDLKLRKEMQLELKRLQRETQITFIFVTHDQEEALTMSDRLAVMKDGKILQTGRPTDIYEKPASAFVADFIGDSNFMTAEWIETRDHGSIFRLASGHLVRVGGDHRQNATIAIRPERIEITGNNDRANRLSGEIKQITYIGTDNLLDVGIGKDFLLKVRRQNGRGIDEFLKVGAPVALVLPEDALQVLDE